VSQTGKIEADKELFTSSLIFLKRVLKREKPEEGCTMSLPLRSLNNQENVPLENGKPYEVTKLEKLLSQQINLSRESQVEQERLEHELLLKESLLYELQSNVRDVNQLNKQLNNQLRTEVEYYEQELQRWQEQERGWKQQFREKDQQVRLLNDVLKSKEDLITVINNELEDALGELELKNREIAQLISEQTEELIDDSEEDQSLLQDESESEDEIVDLILPESDSDESVLLSSSITSELHTKLDETQRLIQEYQFEVKSLKNEKTQLYNYVNRLLRNKPHPKQNEILKEKLVHRKILRTVSTNEQRQGATSRYKSKRVVSNMVNFNSYRCAKPSKFNNNSDDEGDDDDILIKRAMLEFSYVPFALKQFHKLNPLQPILIGIVNLGKYLDLDVD
jgi:hypothetical protein